MAVNKVQLADGTVLMDSTSVTVTPSDLLEGVTALGATGEVVTGTLVTCQIYKIDNISISGGTTGINIDSSIGVDDTWRPKVYFKDRTDKNMTSDLEVWTDTNVVFFSMATAPTASVVFSLELVKHTGTTNYL